MEVFGGFGFLRNSPFEFSQRGNGKGKGKGEGRREEGK